MEQIRMIIVIFVTCNKQVAARHSGCSFTERLNQKNRRQVSGSGRFAGLDLGY
jgi:hypothetical protein